MQVAGCRSEFAKRVKCPEWFTDLPELLKQNVYYKLGQNVVFHKFARQIALIQCSGRQKQRASFAQQIKELTSL